LEAPSATVARTTCVQPFTGHDELHVVRVALVVGDDREHALARARSRSGTRREREREQQQWQEPREETLVH